MQKLIFQSSQKIINCSPWSKFCKIPNKHFRILSGVFEGLERFNILVSVLSEMSKEREELFYINPDYFYPMEQIY